MLKDPGSGGRGTILDDAKSAVDSFLANHSSDALKNRLDGHREQPLYLAEVASLLQRQQRWQQFVDLARCGTPSAAIGQAAQLAPDTTKAVDAAHADAADRSLATQMYLRLGGSSTELFSERYLVELYNQNKLGALHDVQDFETRIRIGNFLGMAEADGLIPAAYVTTLDNPQVGAAYNSDDPLMQGAAGVVEQPIEAIEQRLEKAEAQLAKFEKRLGEDLRTFEPIIGSDPNRRDQVEAAQKYITGFRNAPDYVKVQKEITEARIALGRELALHDNDIEAHAADGAASATAQRSHDLLFQSYAAMAMSDTPIVAVQWVEAHRGDRAFASKADQLQLDSIGETAQAMDASIKMTNLKAIFSAQTLADGSLLTWIDNNLAKPYVNVMKMQALQELPDALRKAQLAIRIKLAGTGGTAAKQAALDALKKEAQHLFEEGLEEHPTLVKKVFTGIGALMSGVVAGDQLAEKGVFAQGADVMTLHDKAQELLQLLRGGVKAGSNEAKEATGLLKAMKVSADVVNKGFAAVGLIGNGFELWENASLALEYDNNPGAWTKVAGNAISIVGCVCLLIPGLEPVGIALGIIGDALGVIGGLLMGDPEGDRIRRIENAALDPGAPADKVFTNDPQNNIPKAITSPNADGNLQAGKAAGVTPDQMQELAKTRPWLFQTENMMAAAEAMRRYFNDPANARHGAVLQAPYRNSLYELLRQSNEVMHSMMNAFCWDYAGDFKMLWHDYEDSYKAAYVALGLPAGAFVWTPGIEKPDVSTP